MCAFCNALMLKPGSRPPPDNTAQNRAGQTRGGSLCHTSECPHADVVTPAAPRDCASEAAPLRRITQVLASAKKNLDSDTTH